MKHAVLCVYELEWNKLGEGLEGLSKFAQV